MTGSQVAKLVQVLIAAFPSAQGTRETSAIYERMLGDLDYVAANAAIERLLATAKFMPTIAEIREAALALTVGPVKRGGEAWGEVLRLIGRYGANRTPGVDFEIADPVAAQVVASLRWRELCLSENQVADRARFVDLYDELAARARRSQAADALPAAQRFRALQEAREQQRQLGEGDQAGEIVAGLARRLGGAS